MNPPISIVMAFRNEGYQVAKTINSINSSITDNQEIEIVVVNDKSCDMSYDNLRYLPHVKYYENSIRLGSSQSKNKAVRLATNENILLIDAHMRFIDHNWSNKITEYLLKNPNKIYCLYTIGFDAKTEQLHHNVHNGCYLDIDSKTLLSNKWSRIHKDTPSSIIAGIMGASYFFTKSYWNKLKGYDGLKLYGREEEYLGIKSWGIGDGCELVNECKIAHLYRNQAPTPITTSELWHNMIVISYTLLPDKYQEKLSSMMSKNKLLYKKLIESIDFNELRCLKDYYTNEGFNFEKFIRINKVIRTENNLCPDIIN